MTHHSPAEIFPWQQKHYQHLLKLQSNNRLAHAWLLEGQAGLGKNVLAQQLAHYFLCQSTGDVKPCGHCPDCLLISAGTHPDLLLIEPEKKVIGVDQVRECINFLANTSQRGQMQIVIINPAEAMNINSSNALLKVLEEPTANALLLLVSHQPVLLMPTIKSRCQSLKIVKPDNADAIKWLQSKNVRENPEILLKLANGAPIKALRLADEEALHERSILHACLEKIVSGKINAVEAAQECANFSINDNIEGMLLCLRDLLAFFQAENEQLVHDPDLQQLSKELAARLNSKSQLQVLHTLYQGLLSAKKNISSTANPNPQLIMEGLFYNWQKLTNF